MNPRKTLTLTLMLGLTSEWISCAAQPMLTNAILFVTQVPMPNERNDSTVSNVTVSVVTPLGNHLGDTAHAGRGGDLWLRLPDGGLKNLTRAAGYGTNGVQHGVGIAVRDPFVHWDGRKALFSMVVGAPANASDTTIFFWQLFEVTNLAAVIANTNTVPAIVKVSNQPSNYNNVMACYGTDGRIIFACDRPRNGGAHLYPQLDEYNNVPSNTGLWSLDPTDGNLFLLDHSPSGSFHPFVDSFGRIIFTRWDHLVQDRNATDDRIGTATNGTFNYLDETSTTANLTNRPFELFPEPRTYDSVLLAMEKVQGNALNSFFPWMMNEDGTGLEILNHVGRHELLRQFRGSSFTNDPSLVQLFNLTPTTRFNTNYLDNFLQIHEDPRNPGTYFGIDGPDFGMHGAGQIVTLFGPPGTNGERMYVNYITGKTNAAPNAFGSFRDPLPMTDGQLVAAYTKASALDVNSGTPAAPKSSYTFRLMTLAKTNSFWATNQFLTPGFSNAASYWNGNLLVTNTSALWELQPVEIVGRAVPTRQSAPVAAIEAKVFADEGVVLGDMQRWLRSNGLALVVSRNVTARDRADLEQPFNLRVPGGVQTLSTNQPGAKLYDISYIQFFQADQLRGLTYGGTNPVPGRRVLATPMHDWPATNYNLPIPNSIPGATQLGLDGSQATFLPARRALSHQTTATNGQHVVRERYWITYQPGEIRTCAVCHGLNVKDQSNHDLATNSPAALRSLLRYWKDKTGYARILSAATTNGGVRIDVSGGSTRTNIVEASDDLSPNSWSPIFTNSGSSSGLYWLLDPNTNQPQRFYRISAP